MKYAVPVDYSSILKELINKIYAWCLGVQQLHLIKETLPIAVFYKFTPAF